MPTRSGVNWPFLVTSHTNQGLIGDSADVIAPPIGHCNQFGAVFSVRGVEFDEVPLAGGQVEEGGGAYKEVRLLRLPVAPLPSY